MSALTTTPTATTSTSTNTMTSSISQNSSSMAKANYMLQQSSANLQNPDTEMRGTLQKWANYVQGYQKRYFVLSKGLLSYYRYY